MKTIQYVENGRCDDEGKPIRVPVPVRSTNGLSLFNANGDVADSATGFKYAIDTMSFIKAEVTTQKFYKVPFADFIPVAVGRGNFSEQIFTNVSFSNAGSFASGIINTGSNTRLANVDAATAKKVQQVRLWAKQLTYSIPEIEQALQANNWDPIMAKEQSRKENWDLGIQEVAFLGLLGDATDIPGLLNQADVTIDTTFITAPISGLDAAGFKTFVAGLISEYFLATNSTQMPTDFVIPYSDFLGLQVLVPGSAGTFPIPMMDYLMKAFKDATQNPNFSVRPLAYCEASRNTAAGINKQCYVLYNKDPRTMQMEVPIQYTTTNANTVNNFSFQNVGYGRFSGLGLFRNLEMLYFRY